MQIISPFDRGIQSFTIQARISNSEWRNCKSTKNRMQLVMIFVAEDSRTAKIKTQAGDLIQEMQPERFLLRCMKWQLSRSKEFKWERISRYFIRRCRAMSQSLYSFSDSALYSFLIKKNTYLVISKQSIQT